MFPKDILILENEPMSRHTTFRVGGAADYMAFPENEDQLLELLNCGMPCLVMGNGSNMLVRDGGIRGLVIVLGERFSKIEVDGEYVTAQAGATLAQLANAAQKQSLSGLEFASGIPGTVGGGCMMNAGAYDGQLSDVLYEAQVLFGGQVCTLSNAEMEMGYRTTKPLREGGIVLGARFKLNPADPEVILNKMRDLNARRREKQPLSFPSAGSTFKRPTGYFAGKLIQDAGLRGYSIGGAQVSEKHSGFIINTGSATANDILRLITHVQKTVFDQFGVHLETEVRILGED